MSRSHRRVNVLCCQVRPSALPISAITFGALKVETTAVTAKTPIERPQRGKIHLEHDGWFNSCGFEDVANFRDVAGGDPAAAPLRVAGGMLKRGLLFRGSQLTFANANDIAIIHEALRIKTYIDLRSEDGLHDNEIFKIYPPSPHPDDFDSVARVKRQVPVGERRRLSCPLGGGQKMGYQITLRKFSDEELTGQLRKPDTFFQLEIRNPKTRRLELFRPELTLDEYVEEIQRFLKAAVHAYLVLSQECICEILKACTTPENYPLLFGCVTGKDRTGLISALILQCLGASEDSIVADYMLSNAAFIHNATLAKMSFDKAREEAIARGEEIGPGFFFDPGDPKNLEVAMVHESVIRYQLALIQEYGGIESYLDSIGFNAKCRAQLRSVLVDDD